MWLCLFFTSEVSGVYRAQRSYENLQRMIYAGVGDYQIPEILPVKDVSVDNWIGFNFALTCKEPMSHGVHFFVDDYQFLRCWSAPETYVPRLLQFQCVCAPDFSLYLDFPRAIQIYNHYRKHWLARYWQDSGVTVIPTINWADHDSYDFCFDGEPVGGCVAVSSIGMQTTAQMRALFLDGYREMLARLRPSTIFLHGDVPDGCTGNIIRIQSFVTKKWREQSKRVDTHKER